MKVTKDTIKQRVEALIASSDKFVKSDGSMDWQLADETTFGSIAIISLIYNDDHEFVRQIKSARDTFLRGNRGTFYCQSLKLTLKGILQTVKYEIDNDIISSIENQARGEVFGDFIHLSKDLLAEGYKDAAAVLACGALEDSLKKFANRKGLDVDDKDLSAVIHSLKAKGLIKGTQSGVVQSYVQLRNKAFHAQFEKIEVPEVASLISFVEQFLLTNFE